MTEQSIGYIVGATIGGVPFWGALVWLVGLFAFKNKAAVERARLLPLATWLVASALWSINGNGIYSLITLPSFLIIWAIRHKLATRAKKPVEHHSWWTE